MRAPGPPAAITPAELLERANHRPGALTPAQLTRWLVSRSLATQTPHGLVATDLGRRLGGAIELVSGPGVR